MRLSLVIPAFNEAQRLPGTLRLVREYLSRQDYESEVIVVEDGSKDGTAEAARAFDGVRVVQMPVNRGKGAAVREGMWKAARGDFRVYYDADASTPIEMLERLWPCFEAGADIVIGSRALSDSDVAVRQVWYRQEMGRMNNRLLRLLGLTPFPDTQCGFKGFTAAACEAVFPRQTIERFSFDAELLYIAALRGLRIDEVPVRWENSPDTRVHPLRDASRMVLDALVIRMRAWRGAYR
ncbi:MAG: glycosyltransferase [Candidatus Hydrogenedens sp.]|nr:glycosyltransferase [Candidatus Hydrogenedens sp.]